MTELEVSVNRSGLHSLEVPETFETDESFDVLIDNHGESTHVHLHLDDRLSTVATLEANNHYVETNESRSVAVHVIEPEQWPEEPLRGRLKVVTGHGQKTRYVEIVLERSPESTPIEVDPELSKPKANREPETPPILRALPVAVLGSVALILAVGTLFAADGVDFVLGAFAILAGAGCAVAAYYLLS